jgi:hypothetical protein
MGHVRQRQQQGVASGSSPCTSNSLFRNLNWPIEKSAALAACAPCVRMNRPHPQAKPEAINRKLRGVRGANAGEIATSQALQRTSAHLGTTNAHAHVRSKNHVHVVRSVAYSKGPGCRHKVPNCPHHPSLLLHKQTTNTGHEPGTQQETAAGPQNQSSFEEHQQS